ncbi:MAG: rhodanese-like domain-containing protein [Candidatus Marinimicrobia bacterium]|nr:rhodanese-like domain-containing protein [Candidatus Neomarinimicrobiota bacterium]
MIKSIFLLVTLVGTGLWIYSAQNTNISSGFKYSIENIPNISVDGVVSKINNKDNILILDVRTKGEYTGSLGHIENSILIPVQELGSRISEMKPYNEKEIIVVCRSGNRSRTGTMILMNAGYRAINMLGGMKAWNKNKN